MYKKNEYLLEFLGRATLYYARIETISECCYILADVIKKIKRVEFFLDFKASKYILDLLSIKIVIYNISKSLNFFDLQTGLITKKVNNKFKIIYIRFLLCAK